MPELHLSVTRAAASATAPMRVSPGPAVAPLWLRPGVIVHDANIVADRLIVDFAEELRRRGFIVRGYARRGARAVGATPLSIDLASGALFAETPESATTHVRQAIDDKADLFSIGRFPACIDAAKAARLPIGAGAARGLPILTTIAGESIHHWHEFVRHGGSMIAPNRRALWQWWGPAPIYRDLILGTADHETRRIVCGQRWVMVEGPFGAGLAYLPRHPRALLPRLPDLQRRSLRELAELCVSWNPLEAALGVAALNAHYNRYDLDGAAGNGVRRFRNMPGPIVVIGAFPGVDSILPDCAIIETDPRPGEYPVAAMDALLPGCGAAVVNSSALINHALERILRLACDRAVALIGPSTPLTPRLHDYGLKVLGGFVARDVAGLGKAIEAGALPRDFARFGRYIHLEDDKPAAD